MKKFLVRFFYWNAPAQGAFFGLTLAAAGNWLWGSVFHALYISFPWSPMSKAFTQLLFVWGGGHLLILLYSIFLPLRFYDQFCGKRYVSFWGRYGWYFGIVLLSLTGGVCGGIPGIAATAFVVLVWALPALLLSRISAKLWLGNALAWTVGFLPLAILWQCLLSKSPFYYESSRGGILPPEHECLPLLFHINGPGWLFTFAAGLLAAVAGYLLTARMLANAEGQKFRRMFGKGVIVLWSLFILAYLAALGAAFAASRSAAENVAKLERRFGRPLTAQAAERLYYNGEKPDAEFWHETARQLSGLDKAIFADPYYPFKNTPGQIPPELQRQWRQHWQENAVPLAELEKRFASIPPLPKREFAMTIDTAPLPELDSYRLFRTLEHWRLEFALQDNDAQETRQVLKQFGNFNRAVARETSLFVALSWTLFENTRLDGLERVLESGLFSDADLREFSRELANVEAQVPVVHERVFYTETFFSLHIFEQLGRGKASDTHTFPIQLFRWLLPQLWRQFAGDKAELARRSNTPDLTHVEAPRELRFPLSDMRLCYLNHTGNRFYGLTARLRAMQVLIAAEEFRRKHGTFPETIEPLPPDPFTGKPLHYRKGDATREIMEFTRKGGRIFEEKRTITFPAMQVWSVGANKIDDGGNGDDIRAMIRLKETR